AAQAAARASEAESASPAPAPAPSAAPTAAPQEQQQQQIANFTVQVATPDAGAIDAALASLRAVPGSFGVGTSSIAIGGTSVLRISFSGTLGDLAAALRTRGWKVTQGAGAL